jgi:hypothetical protein
MPTAICFIEKMRKQERIEDGSDKWKSGNWVVALEKAESLIGKRIYFHEKQIEPSYSGGVVTAVHVLPEDHPETPGRIVFTYIQDSEGIGYLAGSEGWSVEQKTIP